MKFSIVTPTLNAEAFLPAVLESVAAQRHQDWEHIIVDGGSIDHSRDIVKAHMASEPRVRLLEAPGSSIYEAIFMGLDASDGAMLSWLNADDCYVPWTLSSVERFAAARGATWITGFPGAWDAEGRLRFVRPFGWWPRSFIKRGFFHADFLGFIQAESVFFAAQLFRNLAPPQREQVLKAKLAGDYLLWRAFAEHANLEVAPTVLGGFRLHGRNRSLLEYEAYITEVHSSGAWRPPRWLGRRLGKLFQLASALTSFEVMQEADRELRREQGLD